MAALRFKPRRAGLPGHNPGKMDIYTTGLPGGQGCQGIILEKWTYTGSSSIRVLSDFTVQVDKVSYLHKMFVFYEYLQLFEVKLPYPV